MVLIRPELSQNYANLYWICDSVWVVNIPADFITVRNNIESRDGFDIAFDYLKTEFLFDFIATFPTMLSNHSNKLIFLRLFHIF